MESVWPLLPSSVVASPSVTPALLHPFYKDPCNCMELTQIIQHNLSTSRFLIQSCKLINSHVWWVDCRHPIWRGEGPYFANHNYPNGDMKPSGTWCRLWAGEGGWLRGHPQPRMNECRGSALTESEEGTKWEGTIGRNMQRQDQSKTQQWGEGYCSGDGGFIIRSLRSKTRASRGLVLGLLTCRGNEQKVRGAVCALCRFSRASLYALQLYVEENFKAIHHYLFLPPHFVN